MARWGLCGLQFDLFGVGKGPPFQSIGHLYTLVPRLALLRKTCLHGAEGVVGLRLRRLGLPFGGPRSVGVSLGVCQDAERRALDNLLGALKRRNSGETNTTRRSFSFDLDRAARAACTRTVRSSTRGPTRRFRRSRRSLLGESASWRPRSNPFGPRSDLFWIPKPG